MQKNKYVFLGETDSINIEIILKSFRIIKNKYIVIGSVNEIKNYKKKLNSNIGINEIFDPYDFDNLNPKKLNVYDSNVGRNKYEKMINQILLSNKLAKNTGFDLVTMPIDKSLFKKSQKFNGLTEYFGKLNKKKTIMMMVGEIFSIIPITTHISIKSLKSVLTKKKINLFFKHFYNLQSRDFFLKKFKKIYVLCLNPHCGEGGAYSKDDININNLIYKNGFKSFTQLPSDSAFKNIKKNTLYISCYHDQALIPFKIINKKSLNYTLGLDYRRISPAHGTAKNIKFKNKADNSSYIACMEF